MPEINRYRTAGIKNRLLNLQERRTHKEVEDAF